MGAVKPERLLSAGNQQGKTETGAFEFACHTTGLYPDWWKGHRFTHPIRAWAAGVTNRKARDIVQARLMGRRGHFGTGMIPGNHIAGEPIMARGVPGLIDQVAVKHVSGGESIIGFKSYEESVDAWASDTLHLIWFDEEPPEKHYDEGLARFTVTNGICFITTTPLLGMSGVIRRFYPKPNTAERGIVRMGLKDALHIPEHAHEAILRRYPAHERLARAEGKPIFGSGLVYTTPTEVIRIDPFEIPRHFFQIIGIDFGGGQHHFAAVKLAIDRDNGRAYLVAAYKALDPRLPLHAEAVRTMGGTKIPCAWPMDAYQRDRQDGRTYADMMKGYGLKMLPIHAQFRDGTNGVEPGISEIEEAFANRELRVFGHLQDFFDEIDTYHRVDGQIVKSNDDVLDALRYGWMMRRFAEKPMVQVYTLQDMVGMDYDPLNPMASADR